jgi:transposase InsO family protein
MTKENAEMKLRLARLEGMLKTMTTETPAAERDALARAQTRADSVAAMFGDRAPPPIAGETSLDYRRRMLKRFQKHSPTFAKTRFDALDLSIVESVEDRVYADAHESAKQPGDAVSGVLIPVVTREGGRDVTRFHGDIGAFLDPFVPQSMQLVRMNRYPNKGMN